MGAAVGAKAILGRGELRDREVAKGLAVMERQLGERCDFPPVRVSSVYMWQSSTRSILPVHQIPISCLKPWNTSADDEADKTQKACKIHKSDQLDSFDKDGNHKRNDGG